MVLMMEALTFILVRVQAGHDFAPTAASFYRSSLPARVPYFSELDHQIVPAGPLGMCLAHRLKGCERLLKMGPIAELAHEFCIGDSIIHCLEHIKEADDPSVPTFLRCAKSCLSRSKNRSILAKCLSGCFDIIYVHNP